MRDIDSNLICAWESMCRTMKLVVIQSKYAMRLRIDEIPTEWCVCWIGSVQSAHAHFITNFFFVACDKHNSINKMLTI